MSCSNISRKFFKFSTISKVYDPNLSTRKFLNTSARHQSTVAVKHKEEMEDTVRKTGLYDLHIAHGGKMVQFSGYYLPVQYENVSIVSSHLHTRKQSSLFDVSHMLQTNISGKHCIEFLESLCVTDIKGMKNGQSALSLFTHENGGILDDMIITKIDDNNLYLVSNASRVDVDKNLLMHSLDCFQKLGKNVNIEFLDSDEQSLVAIQGPKTIEIIKEHTDIDFSKLYFMTSLSATFCGVKNCRITRCGYTGEDGVEISVPTDKVENIVEILLQNNELKLAGLGARDTLRLEAGLCLYGNDINDTVTPVEAGLTWTISRQRRENRDYPGAAIISDQLKNGVHKRRIGFIQNVGPPARTDCKLIGRKDEIIGHVTSGCPSPSLGVNIAMAYVPLEYSKISTELRISIRNHLYNGTLIKLPFVNTKYYFKPKPTL